MPIESVYLNGGFIGVTRNFDSTATTAPSTAYNDAITNSSGGDPDFRWTFNGVYTELNSHSTTLSGTAPTYTTGLITNLDTYQAADFAAAGYLVPANSTLINAGTFTKRSVSFWFNTDNTGATFPCIWEEGGGTNWMSIYFYNGSLYANIGEGNTTGGHATASVSTGTTYHCVVTFDLSLGSNNIKIYLNGSLAGQATSSVGTDLAAHTGDIRIASGAARNHLNSSITYASYDGRLQDLCYWYEVALTSTDVSNIYNGGIAAAETVIPPVSPGIWNLQAVLESL